MCRRFSQEIQQQIEAKKDVWTTTEGYCGTNGFISVGLAFIPNEARPVCLTSWHRCSCHHRRPSKYMTCSNELLIYREFVLKKCSGKKYSIFTFARMFVYVQEIVLENLTLKRRRVKSIHDDHPPEKRSW